MTTMREKLDALVSEELAAWQGHDFAAMTIDELDEWVVEHRAFSHEELFRPLSLRVAEIRNRKVEEWHIGEARRQIRRVAAEEGLPEETVARHWLDSAQEGRQVQARLYLGLPRIAELSREDLMAKIAGGEIVL